MDQNNDLSIITINYNGLQDTCELIDSIKDHVKILYDLIVVDNSSDSNEADLIATKYPEVIIVRNTQNSGFAGGNNAGIKINKRKYILLINNDTVVKDNSVQFLIDKLESDPTIGAASPKIKDAFSPETIQYAGYTTLSSVTLRNRTIGSGEIDNGQYDQAKPTSYLHGAAMIIKRDVIEKVGLMPEIYFLYYEELDWSMKIKQMGYSLFYVPQCTIFHKESQSTGKESKLRVFFMTRNRLLFAYRNLRGMTKYLSIIYQVLVVCFRNCIVFLGKGKPALAFATLSGAYHFFVLKSKKR